MPTGLNGQPVLSGWSDPALTTIKVPGSKIKLTVHKGWYQRVAAYVAWRWHQEVEPLKAGQCWGFDYRVGRASSGWSSHSTGYCIDLNSNGAGSQLWGDRKLKATAAQMRAMAAIKKDTGLLWGGPRWAGGDYGPSNFANGAWVDHPKAKFVDPMHWDLPHGVNAEQWCKDLCLRLNIGPDGRPVKKPVVAPVKPVPGVGGPYWLLRWLRSVDCPRVTERAWWSIAMRESNGRPTCIYPAGSPKVSWNTAQSPYWDTGLFQVNNRWLPEVKKMFGSDADMRKMLDPNNSWVFAQKYLTWRDWGLRVSPDGSSYVFDWTGWPSDWVAKNSAEAEKSFRFWWDQYPVAVKKVYP